MRLVLCVRARACGTKRYRKNWANKKHPTPIHTRALVVCEREEGEEGEEEVEVYDDSYSVISCATKNGRLKVLSSLLLLSLLFSIVVIVECGLMVVRCCKNVESPFPR